MYYINNSIAYPKNIVSPTYERDDEPYIGDYWMNADYYLSNGLVGDCEDFAIGIASILEAKGVPNMIVGRTGINGSGHIYTQYFYNDEYYTAEVLNGNYYNYGLRNDYITKKYKHVWMFNATSGYMDYKNDWNIDN